MSFPPHEINPSQNEISIDLKEDELKELTKNAKNLGLSLASLLGVTAETAVDGALHPGSQRTTISLQGNDKKISLGSDSTKLLITCLITIAFCVLAILIAFKGWPEITLKVKLDLEPGQYSIIHH